MRHVPAQVLALTRSCKFLGSPKMCLSQVWRRSIVGDDFEIPGFWWQNLGPPLWGSHLSSPIYLKGTHPTHLGCFHKFRLVRKGAHTWLILCESLIWAGSMTSEAHMEVMRVWFSVFGETRKAAWIFLLGANVNLFLPFFLLNGILILLGTLRKYRI